MIEALISVFGVWFVGGLIYWMCCDDNDDARGLSIAVLWPVWLVRSVIRNAKEKWNEDTK